MCGDGGGAFAIVCTSSNIFKGKYRLFTKHRHPPTIRLCVAKKNVFLPLKHFTCACIRFFSRLTYNLCKTRKTNSDRAKQ